VESFKMLSLAGDIKMVDEENPEGVWAVGGEVGLRMAEDPTPVQPGDKFSLGEASRLLTALLAARLVDQGLLKWNTTVKEAFIDTGLISTTTTQYYYDMTFLDLLLNNRNFILPPLYSSYFSTYWLDLFDLIGSTYDWTSGDANRQARLLMAQSLFTLDWSLYIEESEGSDAVDVLAASFMEAMTNTNYETLIQQEVFDPLGLEGCILGPTTLDPSLPPVQPWGHQAGPWGVYNIPLTPGPQAYETSTYGPYNGISCNRESLRTLLDACLYKDTQFLTADSWEKFFTPSTDGLSLGFECNPYDYEYGCYGNRAFYVATQDPSDPFSAVLAVFPESMGAMVILTNTNLQDGMRQKLARDLVIYNYSLQILGIEDEGDEPRNFLAKEKHRKK